MNKDLSDYNYLKNQQDPVKKFDKYKQKLSTKPSETLKYYSYLTNVQPLFDELIYFNEDMKKKEKELKDKEKEIINKDKEVKNEKLAKEIFADEIKPIKKEVKPKEEAKVISLKDDLFAGNETLKEPSPIINEEIKPIEVKKEEPKTKKEKKKTKKEIIKDELFTGSEKPKKNLLKNIYDKAQPLKEIIKNELFTSNEPVIKEEPIKKKKTRLPKKEIKEVIEPVITEEPIKKKKTRLPKKEIKEVIEPVIKEEPKKKKGGRPKGSTTNYDTLEFNREAKTLDISGDTPVITKKKKAGRPKKSKK